MKVQPVWFPDDRTVAALVANGLSFTCANCEHWWVANHRGQSRCDQDCRGPYGGQDFPRYRGPLEGVAATMVCFRCGERSSAAFRIRDGRVLGCCKTHKIDFGVWTKRGVRPESTSRAIDCAKLELLER